MHLVKILTEVISLPCIAQGPQIGIQKKKRKKSSAMPPHVQNGCFSGHGLSIGVAYSAPIVFYEECWMQLS